MLSQLELPQSSVACNETLPFGAEYFKLMETLGGQDLSYMLSKSASGTTTTDDGSVPDSDTDYD